MTELSELRQIWNATPEDVSKPLSREQLVRVVLARRENVRKRIQWALRQEMWNYIVIAIGILAAIFLKNGAWRGLIGTGVFAGLVGMVFVTLLHKARQLGRAPMGGSLKETLRELLDLLDSTARAYLLAYMVLIVTGLGAMVGVAIWKLGVGFFSFVVLATCTAGVVWAYRSGQAYVRQMFGPYRRELLECLREVEAA